MPQTGPLTQCEGPEHGEQGAKEQEGAAREPLGRRREEKETKKGLISLFLPTAECNARHHAGMQPSQVFPSMDIRYKTDCEAGAVKSSNQDDDRNQEQPDDDVILERGGMIMMVWMLRPWTVLVIVWR